MKKIYNAALGYLVLGLLAGLFYREVTRSEGFTGQTQLAVAHTHLLALGMMLFLVVLALDAALALSGTRVFRRFFWLYNAGLLLTVSMLVVHGTMTVYGREAGPAVAGVAGLGHLLLTAGLGHLFVAVRRALPRAPQARPVPAADLAE